ncbi:membrane transport protein-domain-containing protein [Mycena pura]|uniref:Membrane transport protein-domain-containing protein n=1 Tax=Mycena pura TaxID=153505 RepID=A0AAD6YHB6_9AGAR|nr:membrane transport protein-domain-containing protein [Mycena pura]
MSSLQTVMSPGCSRIIAAAADDTPILSLLATVFISILEVFLLCLAGYILAARGILDKKTQKQLNRINVSLFTPCLLFSKVAFFLSPEKLKELWIIPMFFVIVTAVSMSIAYILGSMFRVKRSQRSFAMAAAMFMNSNSLPIALMQSLIVSVDGLKWGLDDNKNSMVGRALTYLVLYSTLGMVLRWSYGVRLLAQSDPESEENVDEDTSVLPHHQSPSGDTFHPVSVVHADDPNPRPEAHREHAPSHALLRVGHERRRSRFYNSFPNSPNQSRLQLPTIESDPASPAGSTTIGSSSGSDLESDGEAVTAPLLLPRGTPADISRGRQASHSPGHARNVSTASHAHPGSSTLRNAGRRLHRAWVALNAFMTVPLWAAFASVIVAAVGPLQHALDEHMQPVKGALTSAGNCSIPITLIVLGGYFYPEKPPALVPSGAGEPLGAGTSMGSVALLDSVRDMFGRQKQMQGASSHNGETKTVVISVLSRMILTPMLLLPLMALSARFDLHAIFEDPVFVVANVLLVSSPPALTLAQITQTASGDAFERLISRTIFWAYCVVTPPATIVYVVIGLMLSKL